MSIDALLNGLLQIVMLFERLVMQIHNCSRALDKKIEHASSNRNLLPNRCLYPLEYIFQIIEYNVSYKPR